MNKPHNLYFHIPYCASKCRYCAFYSMPCANPEWDSFADGILAEIDHWSKIMGKIDIPTIFFGGGTPSLMPVVVFERIMNAVRENFNVLPDCEITVECNPGTITAEKLIAFQKIGMNRISVGVQSFDDDILKFMGRCHNANTALDLINKSLDLGLRVSADFIYGLPNQTVDDVKNLCNQINNLGIEHCSMYELIIEPGTPFADMKLDVPDNETMADMYETIGETLAMPRYEVSNYGTPCHHNQNIWDGEPYIGFGTAAAGRPLINNVWHEQMGNNEMCEKMTDTDRAIERVIMGLRSKKRYRIG
ncbi:radical SAM family heme chaperone HemW [Lachnospiraceae bacterium OttesenSCG-928-E19]|nr:radical SAM family heme chaperone HemW [Lachnospiraceae bacterium OttesenSCG-928-E19]